MHTVGLPNRRAPRTRTPKLIPTLILLALCFVASTAATQWLASKFAYHAALGKPIFAHVYPPWQWIRWSFSFYAAGKPYFDRAFIGITVSLGSVAIVYAIYIALAARRLSGIDDLHGSAHWASRKEVEATGLIPRRGEKGAGVYVGAWRDNGTTRYLRHNGPEHVLAFAPTRSGKGVGLILPTLLSWPESTVVFDLKGENWALTSGYRKSIGHTVLAFDPTDTEGRGVGYNPLEEVRIRTEHEIADAQNIVQQIVDPDGKGLETHWDKTSFMFLVGAILYTIYHHAGARHASLADVADSLSSEGGIDQLYARMKENRFGSGSTTHPVIAKSAIDMLEKEPRERGSVLSTAKTFFALYADPVVARNIAKSGFRIADLMNAAKPVSLYLIVDPSNKARLKPLIRLILTQIVRNLTPRLQFQNGQAVRSYKHRLLLMLDEFPSLGKLPIFQDALAHIAGYGIKAYLITQDLTQLTDAYGQHESILSNCHVRVAYAPNRIETAQLLSNMTGTATVIKRQVSQSGARTSAILGQASVTLQEHQRPLLTPDECMRLPAAQKNKRGEIEEAGDVLIFVAGHPPIYGRQALYFQDATFAERSRIPEPAKSDALC